MSYHLSIKEIQSTSTERQRISGFPSEGAAADWATEHLTVSTEWVVEQSFIGPPPPKRQIDPIHVDDLADLGAYWAYPFC